MNNPSLSNGIPYLSSPPPEMVRKCLRRGGRMAMEDLFLGNLLQIGMEYGLSLDL